MVKTIATGKKVFLRELQPSDFKEFSRLVRESREFLSPWVNPPVDEFSFKNMLSSSAADNHRAFLICQNETGNITGIINLTNIIRGNFQNGFLGYYIGKEYSQKGFMTEGMMLALTYIFGTLKLHRVEANIQPGNLNSIKLVQKCGFRNEGFSPLYLKIDNAWRDHERWAMTFEQWDKQSRM